MAEPNNGPDAQPISVLMAEDDASFVTVIQYHLKNFTTRSFQLTWKESVDSALAEIRDRPAYDVILTDFSFPRSNGLELCLHLNRIGCKVPIIFITGSRDLKLAVEAMKLGVEDYLVKEDLNETTVPRTILNVIERSHMRRQMQTVEKRMKIAEHRAQAIRELVVTVCHEFNNPLAAIKISSDLVHRSLDSKEDLTLLENFERNFQRIETEIKRLRDINFEKFELHNGVLTRGN